jgi:hypothetical protein
VYCRNPKVNPKNQPKISETLMQLLGSMIINQIEIIAFLLTLDFTSFMIHPLSTLFARLVKSGLRGRQEHLSS